MPIDIDNISPAAVIAAFSDHRVKLPLQMSDADTGVVLDDDGVDIITVDVNSTRPNAEADAIAMLIVSAVNHLAGLEGERVDAPPSPETQMIPTGVVSVCPECDIAGCRHLRAAPATPPGSHVVPDFRALAVEIVDGIRGYTYEFSSNPAAHKDDYDFIEGKLRAAIAAEGRDHG